MSFLLKIRKQIYELISKNSKVIDIGCGKGELLRELSGKIKYGLGIDINKKRINFANKKKRFNLEFQVANFKKLNLNEKFDYSIAMFMIHSLDYFSQIKTLENMKKVSKKQIIVDYILPKNIFYKLFISFDELLAGHYNNFKNYKKIKMEKLISDSELKLNKKTNTIKNWYNLWICE